MLTIECGTEIAKDNKCLFISPLDPEGGGEETLLADH